MARTIPVVGFVGSRGVGKTTLLTRLLPLLRTRGLQVAVVKQARPNFEIDHPGKDSFELRKAGAVQTLVASRERWALIVETPAASREPRLDALLGYLDDPALDLVLVEGFADESIPKIEVHRPTLGQPLLFPDDPLILALATDQLPTAPVPLPVLPLDRPSQIAEFVYNRVRTPPPEGGRNAGTATDALLGA